MITKNSLRLSWLVKLPQLALAMAQKSCADEPDDQDHGGADNSGMCKPEWPKAKP